MSFMLMAHMLPSCRFELLFLNLVHQLMHRLVEQGGDINEVAHYLSRFIAVIH
jgi:hypothetical protein